MNADRGFTLVEMVVVIALASILSLVITQMFISQYRIYNSESSELVVQNDARVALDDVDNYVRSANRVINSYSTYTTGANTLILQIQSYNATNQLLPAYDTVVFYQSGSALFRQVFPDASSSRTAVTKQLAGDVTALTFTYNDADMSQVTDIATELTVLDTNPTQNRSITVSSSSHLRNY